MAVVGFHPVQLHGMGSPPVSADAAIANAETAPLAADATHTADAAAPAKVVPLPTDEHLGAVNLNPPGMSLWELWKEDFATHDGDLLAQGFWAIAVHRLGNWRMGIRSRLLRLPFSLLFKFLYK